MTSIAPRNSTAFTDTLPDNSEELEAVVRAERKQLKASIEELGSAMREKVDVRTQFREHPLAAVGIGFAAGIVLGVVSNRVTNVRGASSARRVPHHRDDEAAEHFSSANGAASSGKMGKFAAAMMGMVGSRVAELAEDTLRESLARRRFTVPARQSQAHDR